MISAEPLFLWFTYWRCLLKIFLQEITHAVWDCGVWSCASLAIKRATASASFVVFCLIVSKNFRPVCCAAISNIMKNFIIGLLRIFYKNCLVKQNENRVLLLFCLILWQEYNIESSPAWDASIATTTMTKTNIESLKVFMLRLNSTILALNVYMILILFCSVMMWLNFIKIHSFL